MWSFYPTIYLQVIGDPFATNFSSFQSRLPYEIQEVNNVRLIQQRKHTDQ